MYFSFSFLTQPGQGPPPMQPVPMGPAPVVQEYNHGQGGSSAPPGPIGLPPFPVDLSRPPPGFPPVGPGVPPGPGLGPGAPPPPFPEPPPRPQITDADLTPSVPYYELPAGLLAPLVKVSLEVG